MVLLTKHSFSPSPANFISEWQDPRWRLDFLPLIHLLQLPLHVVGTDSEECVECQLAEDGLLQSGHGVVVLQAEKRSESLSPPSTGLTHLAFLWIKFRLTITWPTLEYSALRFTAITLLSLTWEEIVSGPVRYLAEPCDDPSENEVEFLVWVHFQT